MRAVGGRAPGNGVKHNRKTMSISYRTRFQVLERDSFTCQYCGAIPPGAQLQIDHFHPRSRGGSDDISNLITACRECNQGKSDSVVGNQARLIKTILQRRFTSINSTQEGDLEQHLYWANVLIEKGWDRSLSWLWMRQRAETSPSLDSCLRSYAEVIW